jgi:hypothetical protein
MRFPGVTLRLPDWVEDLLAEEDRLYPVVEDRVRLAIELSRSNIYHRTGGPSGPRSSSGRLAACSVRHVPRRDPLVGH